CQHPIAKVTDNQLFVSACILKQQIVSAGQLVYILVTLIPQLLSQLGSQLSCSASRRGKAICDDTLADTTPVDKRVHIEYRHIKKAGSGVDSLAGLSMQL